MKVYFTASLTGKKLYGDNDKRIVTQLVKLGHKVSQLVMDSKLDEVMRHSEEENMVAYRKVRKFIDEADLVVAEMSYSSIAVGFEITTALNLGKRVLLFHVPGKYSPLLEGVKNSGLNIVEYKLSEVEQVVTRSIEEIEKKIDLRFNFFISNSLFLQLEKVSKDSGLNKSEFVRKLIEKDMKRNKRFVLSRQE